MSANTSDLTDLRRRIDAIDDRMHELLIERAEIVAEIAASKRGGDVAFYQPAREAQILRRLAARHHGPLAVASVLRIWREMLAATVRLETPFAVAVFAPAEAGGFWDLARDHYGSHTAISAHATIGGVIRALRGGNATIGVLPMPQEVEPDPWWRDLASPIGARLQVMARLPFGPRGNARASGCDALVIGRGAQQPTGMDRTLFITEMVSDSSPARLLDRLSSAGLTCTFLARGGHGDGMLRLAEIDGFVPAGDARIADFRTRSGRALHRLLPFGGYAVPLSLQPLSLQVHSPAAAKG